MASYTPHYNLKKPAYSDTADIADINSNMDTLDTSLYDFTSGFATTKVTDLNDCTATAPNYYCESGSANTPTNGWYFCRVLNSSSGYITQIATPMNSESGNIYIRQKSANAWGSWKPLNLSAFMTGCSFIAKSYTISNNDSLTVESLGIVNSDHTTAVVCFVPNVVPQGTATIYCVDKLSSTSYGVTKIGGGTGTTSTQITEAGVVRNNFGGLYNRIFIWHLDSGI